jgi:hypothetical protein
MQAEANRFLERSSSVLLEHTKNKRQCFGFETQGSSCSSNSNIDHFEKKKNPATAALEAALVMDEAIGFDTTTFDSDYVYMSIYSSFAVESAALCSQDLFPFKHTNYKGTIPSVDTVENVAGILSKLSTSTAA